MAFCAVSLFSDTHCILNELSLSIEAVKNGSFSQTQEGEGFQETGVFPLSFGFALVTTEKAISSSDRVAFRAERQNGRGCISLQVLVKNKKSIVVAGFVVCQDCSCFSEESTRLLTRSFMPSLLIKELHTALKL